MKAVFLCESCKKAVSYKTNRCPYCGRFFTAVLCPNCKITGKPKEFLHGCPRCGYLGKEATLSNKAFLLSKNKKSTIQLPLWFYKLAGIVVFIILITIIIWYLISILY